MHACVRACVCVRVDVCVLVLCVVLVLVLLLCGCVCRCAFRCVRAALARPGGVGVLSRCLVLVGCAVCAFVVRKVLQNPLYDPGVPLKAPMLAVCPRDSATNCGGLGCDERSHRNPQGCFGKSPTTPRLRDDITRWELFELRDDARACRCLRCGARNHAKRMPQLLHASATRVYTQAVTICGHVYAA